MCTYHKSMCPPPVWTVGGRWGEESRNISRPLPPSTFTAPPQDTQWIQNNSTYYTKRSTAIPGPLRKPCSSMCRTQPSTGTLGNISYLTDGTTSFWHHQPYSASLPAIQLHPLPLTPTYLLVFPPPSSCCPYWQGAHTFMVSTNVCPKHTPYTPNTPTPNLQVLQQHHLGKFLIFYFLG